MRQPALTDILPIVRAAGEIILRRFGCTALELCYIACAEPTVSSSSAPSPGTSRQAG